MRGLIVWGMVGMLGWAAPAHADAAKEAKLVAALELFNAAAFWSDGGMPNGGYERSVAGVIRWANPIRVFVGPSTTSSARREAEEKLREVAAIADQTVEFVDSAEKANLKFNFIQEYQAPAGLPAAGCVTQFKAPGYSFADVTIHIRLNQQSCMLHEIMHAFGFIGHPHRQETVLSYTFRGGTSSTLTDLDRLVLGALYRGKLRPGMPHLPALVLVRQHIAEDLGLVPVAGDTTQFARPFFDAVVTKLRDVAQKGDVAVQYQLGIAYAVGQYVAKDFPEALRYWDLAAAQKLPDAHYIAGLFLAEGEGVPADPTSAIARLKAASELGHAPAAQKLAEMLETRGDLIEAYAYFDLATRRKVTNAAKRRDDLGRRFSGDDFELAKNRARQLVAVPPG